MPTDLPDFTDLFAIGFVVGIVVGALLGAGLVIMLYAEGVITWGT